MLPLVVVQCVLQYVVPTLYYVAISFHRRVWYRVFSLCYVCI